MTKISIEIDETTEVLVKRLAEEAGVSVSDFSRDALLDYVKKFANGCITTSRLAKSA